MVYRSSRPRQEPLMAKVFKEEKPPEISDNIPNMAF